MGIRRVVSVITVKRYDTGQTEVVLTFDREIGYNDYWDILGSYTHGFPVWLNDEFLRNKVYIDQDTNDEYKLEDEIMLIL